MSGPWHATDTIIESEDERTSYFTDDTISERAVARIPDYVSCLYFERAFGISLVSSLYSGGVV